MTRHIPLSIGVDGQVKMEKEMFPTPYLRYIIREGKINEPLFVNVLQVWWAETSINNTYTDPENSNGEWRDVQTEKE